jgi:hypothetical protein
MAYQLHRVKFGPCESNGQAQKLRIILGYTPHTKILEISSPVHEDGRNFCVHFLNFLQCSNRWIVQFDLDTF